MTISFSACVDSYIAYCRVELAVSDATLAKYRDCFRSWLLPHFGELPIADVTRDHVHALRAAMVKRRLSASRQYSVLVVLKSCLRFCRDTHGYRTLDPAMISLPKRPMPEVAYLTNVEVARVLAAIDLHTYSGARLRALVELLLATGMRISEALSLDRAPFDAGVDELEVVGKGMRRRAVFLSARCRAWVANYLAKRLDDDRALFVTTGYPPSRLRREDTSRFFILLRRKARITKHLTPHLLRHTFCTNLLQNGVDITFIRDLAGHADIQTTARYYLGVDKRALKRAVTERLQYEDDASASVDLQLRLRDS